MWERLGKGLESHLLGDSDMGPNISHAALWVGPGGVARYNFALKKQHQKGKRSHFALRTQEETDLMPPPPTSPCLAPLQLVFGRGHNLRFTPQIPGHLHLSQVFPPPILKGTTLSRRRCLALAYFYNAPTPSSPRCAPQSLPAFPT